MQGRTKGGTATIGLFVLSVALGLTACSDGGDPTPTNAPTELEYDEIATAVGPLVTSGSSGEVSVLLQTTAVANGKAPEWMTGTSSGRFRGQHLGISYDYDVRCEDAAGFGVPCGPGAFKATAAAIWRGAIDLPWYDAAIDFQGDWTLTKLNGTEATLLGGAEAEVMTHFMHPDGTKRHLFVHYASNYDVMRIDPVTGHPVAGSARYDLDVRHTTGGGADTARRFQVVADLIWSRSNEAQLVLDGTRYYRLRTDTGEVVLDGRVHGTAQ